MKFSDIAKYSFKNLQHRKLRSWLTILGIVIGIASVVSLLTIGIAFNAQINEELSGFGYNVIYVMPMTMEQMYSAGPTLPPTAGKLFEKDLERLKKIPEITEISRLIEDRATVRFKDKEVAGYIEGVEPGIFEKFTSVEIESGRFLVGTDRRVAVVGASFADDAFGKNMQVRTNNYIYIGGAKYRVVGVLKPAGSSIGAAMDDVVFIHFEDAREVFDESMAENEVGYIAMTVQEGADMDDVVERIELEMDNSHKVREDERDYGVITLETMQEAIGTVLGLATLFIGAVAAISLVVGGLAIATSMYTSVVERTKEIGILKAVGANQHDIQNIFLFESGTIGGIGGVIGTLLGLFIVYLVSLFGMPARIDIGIAVFGIVFAVFVGIGSGYFPARRAAKMLPVEAFRA